MILTCRIGWLLRPWVPGDYVHRFTLCKWRSPNPKWMINNRHCYRWSFSCNNAVSWIAIFILNLARILSTWKPVHNIWASNAAEEMIEQTSTTRGDLEEEGNEFLLLLFIFFSRAKIRHSGIINQWPPSVYLKRGWALSSSSNNNKKKIFAQRSHFFIFSWLWWVKEVIWRIRTAFSDTFQKKKKKKKKNLSAPEGSVRRSQQFHQDVPVELQLVFIHNWLIRVTVFIDRQSIDSQFEFIGLDNKQVNT